MNETSKGYVDWEAEMEGRADMERAIEDEVYATEIIPAWSEALHAYEETI